MILYSIKNMNKITTGLWVLLISTFLIVGSLISAGDGSIRQNIHKIINAPFLEQILPNKILTVSEDQDPRTKKLRVNPNNDSEDLSNFLYFFTGFVTALLALIAYYNLQTLNNTNKEISSVTRNKMLIQIDQRWGNHEIIKARQIIHVIYRIVCDHFDYENPKNDEDTKKEIIFSKVYPTMGKIIIELSLSKNSYTREAFPYLINYLDLMESLAYIYKNADDNHLTELESFCGDTLVFNFGVFNNYLKFKNDKHPSIIKDNKETSDRFYNTFLNFIDNLQKVKSKKDYIDKIKEHTINEKYKPLKYLNNKDKSKNDFKTLSKLFPKVEKQIRLLLQRKI
jgi:hypothetical protein